MAKMTSRRAGSVARRVHHAKAKLRHAALTRTPLWLSRGRLRHAKAIRHYRTTELEIGLPGLHSGLEGLRIVHLSDPHVGDLVPVEHLAEVVDAANALKGDLVAVTGDLIDLSHDVLDGVIEAVGRLRAPLGVHFVAGNHDYLQDRDGFIQRFREAGLGLLLNQRLNVQVGGALLTVAGIDYAARRSVLSQHVNQALRSRPIGRSNRSGAADSDARGPRRSQRSDRSDATILLSHHPNAFDAAAKLGVDLTLAGHTHGGQVVMSDKRGKKGSIGLASLAHRYPKGHFQKGDAHLYVTSGIGSWFPLRVKCPPEIAVVTLRDSRKSEEQENRK